MVIIQIKLVIAVKEIDKGTSPFEIEVNIFDVAPPGTAAMIITPTAISGGKLGYKITNKKAIKGNKIICDVNPTITSLGCLKTLVKSETFNPNPNENIIKAMHILNKRVVNSIPCINIRF